MKRTPFWAAFRTTSLRCSLQAGGDEPTPAQSNPSGQRVEQLTGLTATLAQFPMLRPNNTPPVAMGDKIGTSLLSQRYIQRDAIRERRFAMCARCGHTTVTIGFDGTPSARLGMTSRCGDHDFSHHSFRLITEQDYLQLRPMKLNERLTWFAFHR